MKSEVFPGTVMPYKDIDGGVFSIFRPMIKATDGLTLGQVSAITGLEYSTIQNWVKRGFVAHPVNKKYYERHLARILIISMMRDSMKIDEIGELLRTVNGNASDESDDIISETRLYEYLCEILDRSDIGKSDEQLRLDVEAVTADYVGPTQNSRHCLTLALTVMACACIAGRFIEKAQQYFKMLK